MFDSIFPKHWTTLQRLMWLKTNALARAVYETLGPAPIVSFTALRSAPLKSLTQYGKCETVSAVTEVDPVMLTVTYRSN